MHYPRSIHHFFKRALLLFVQSIFKSLAFPCLRTHEKCYHLLPRSSIIDDTRSIHVRLQRLILNLRRFRPNGLHINKIFNFLDRRSLTIFNHLLHDLPNHCHQRLSLFVQIRYRIYQIFAIQSFQIPELSHCF